MKVAFLGTSSASVTAERDNVSLLVECDKNLVLIDCSGNPAGKLLKLGFDPNNLDTVLLTHLHIDHCYGLPTLLFHMFLNGRTRPLNIAVPAQEFSLLEEQLKVHGLYPDFRAYKLNKIPISEEDRCDVWSDGSCLITAAPGEHTRPTLAYRIDATDDSKSIIFSGDSRPSSHISKLAAKATLLIHEATYLDKDQELAMLYRHSTAREAGTVARNADVKQLALIHLELPVNGVPEQFKTEAEQVYNGKILIPGDLEILEI